MPRAAPAFLMTVATALAASFPALGAFAAAADGPPPGAAAAGAAERGWFGQARELRQQDGAEGVDPTEFLARLDAVEREVDRATRRRAHEQSRRWTAGTCRTLWRHDIGSGIAAGPPAVAGDLVLWTMGAAVHAVRLADGLPAWPPGAASHDTRLFPRGSGAAPAGPRAALEPPPAAPSVVGGRGYAVLAREAGEALACLDLSPAAEGRLVWLVDVATLVAAGQVRVDGPLVCDGPPAVDHELCCLVLRPAAGRDELIVAAFAAADGRLEWMRRCGTALAADGVDHGRGRRRPVFSEDRIVLATHAGVVVSFDRDGRSAWRTETPRPVAHAVENGAAASLAAHVAEPPDAIAAGGLVIVAPRDAGGVVAIETRGGGVAWRWHADDGVAGLLGPVEDGVVVVTRPAGDATSLVRLDRSSGREAVPPVALAGRSAGALTLVDHTLFRPRARMRGPGESGIAIDVLDPVSLASRPLVIDIAPSATAGDADAQACFVAGGHGILAVATPGAITCFEAPIGTNRGEASR